MNKMQAAKQLEEAYQEYLNGIGRFDGKLADLIDIILDPLAIYLAHTLFSFSENMINEGADITEEKLFKIIVNKIGLLIDKHTTSH